MNRRYSSTEGAMLCSVLTSTFTNQVYSRLTKAYKLFAVFQVAFTQIFKLNLLR